jgi:hypothetical protein
MCVYRKLMRGAVLVVPADQSDCAVACKHPVVASRWLGFCGPAGSAQRVSGLCPLMASLLPGWHSLSCMFRACFQQSCTRLIWLDLGNATSQSTLSGFCVTLCHQLPAGTAVSQKRAIQQVPQSITQQTSNSETLRLFANRSETQANPHCRTTEGSDEICADKPPRTLLQGCFPSQHYRTLTENRYINSLKGAQHTPIIASSAVSHQQTALPSRHGPQTQLM